MRAAKEGDAPAVLEVTRAANAEFEGRWAISALGEEVEHVLADIGAGRVLIATVSEECIGSVRCRVLEDGKGYVKRLSVDPKWRRHGVGRRLMAAAEDWLMRAGVSVVSLGTVADNPVATAFYSDLGYRRVEQRYLPHRGFTATAWEKHLVRDALP